MPTAAAAMFHALVGDLEYPMFIVTTRAGDESLGCVVGEVDKFARCAWHEGPEGVPILDDCPNWFVGRVVWRHDAGDHDSFLLEPVAAHRASGEDEFTFHRAKRIDAGHAA